VQYEQFFMGILRVPPAKEHEALRRSLAPLRMGSGGAAVRFRVDALQQRLQSFERMWSRTVREMEEGTYRRDLFRARLRARGAGEAGSRGPGSESETSTAGAAPGPGTKRRDEGAAGNGKQGAGNFAEEKMDRLFRTFVEARRRCNESTDGLSREQLAAMLNKQLPMLQQKHNAREFDFQVVIRGGKAALKAVPKG
jgi:hypothetical protein